ncbi:2-methylcitrate dehydratase [Pelagimonas phthalicica]|uniref:2-methylcitrate dehydratase n=1 Tax=Pelagimonas phthalicica TaxID=1037362 RepID=A0A238JDM9_9RHOB|nr:MmgE/PrpD family protein [Pelagimonas phthalicica]TDS91690.1 2-methylcitrate dehydratase PrpD [Pelagimonas phthalicica]SMX28739.1 2-methylcitrate dehydratase [Pelagimonas phthalicica]
MDNWLSPALREPTQEALEIMRLSLVDWLACGLAGVDEPVAHLTRAMVLDEGGAEQSSLFGGGKAPARAAALVNGATSHALDYDDTHFAHIGHPSVAVNSAALAVAEREGADFDAFLRACLAGCEASIRFGVLLGRDHYQIGFHQTATAGAFGATVAAGLLLGLSDAQMRHALGLVSTRASGLKSQFGTMGKPYNAGIAAANGVEAADLARRGFVSNPEALIGQNGFVTTHHGRGVEASTDDWLMEQISHKFHACCHGLHATLEALAMLDPGPVKDIQKIEITTHPRWMTVCNQHSPKTGLEAKFSYRAVTALALLGHDTASLDSYRDELMQDPEVLALMDKVAVTSEPSLAETEARVVVTRQGVANASFDLNTPLSLQTRSDKIRAKAQVLTGDDRVWQAVQAQELTQIVGLLG